MVRILPSLTAALVACACSPQETDMHSSDPSPRTNAQSLSETAHGGQGQDTPPPAEQGAGFQPRLSEGPIPASGTAAKNPLAPPPADSTAEQEGRRTLSTAFVMIGADAYLTVGLHDGRVIVLRNVVMRREDYCGVQVLGSAAGVKFCGKYGEVATARPGNGLAPGEPNDAQ